MSDTPPDRKEAGDAPEGPRNPYVRFIGWAILTPLLYVLSTGPMWWLVCNGYIRPETMQTVYSPLHILSDKQRAWRFQYEDWWAKEPPYVP